MRRWTVGCQQTCWSSPQLVVRPAQSTRMGSASNHTTEPNTSRPRRNPKLTVCVETSSIRHKVTSYPAFRKGSKKAMSFSSVEMYTRFFPLRRSKGSTLWNILDASILVSRYLAASGYHFQTYWNTAQRGHRTENHHVEYVVTYTCPGLPFGPHPLRRVHKCLGGSELCRALNV